MRRHSKHREGSCSSQQKMQQIYNQEQKVSRAFQLNEFYDQFQHLNLQQLKKRLNTFKKQTLTPTHPKSKMYKVMESPVSTFKGEQNAKFNHELPVTHTPVSHPNKKNGNYVTMNNYKSEATTHRNHNETIKSNHWLSKKPKIETPVFRTRTHTHANYRSNLPKNVVVSTLYSLEKSKNKKLRTSVGINSKCSESSHQHSFQEANFENTIRVNNQGETSELENRVQNLWAHYQLLTKILLGLRDGNQQKNAIVNYVHTVCSNHFQFLKELISTVNRNASSKSEINTAKRLSKVVILSRLYENIGIVYVSLYLCLNIKIDSHIVNVVGYATSSLAFTIRLLAILHLVPAPLMLSKSTTNILDTIQQFERGTYGGKIVRVSEVVMRLEQNNEVMAIVQGKICHQMDSQFQDTINNLLKNVDLDTKELSEYATYLFQFLSFHLASLGVYGHFPALELPPAPYLNILSKRRTLVIEPWGVLFARKDKYTYIRAHTQTFLCEVEKHWNIVYWSQLMPKDIDDLLERLPKGNWLYRYHCIQSYEHCIKPLERVGVPLTNTIVIDRSELNFHSNHRQLLLKMPWKAQKRDIKLLQLLDLLRPHFLDEETPLEKLIEGVRAKLSGTIKRKANQKPPTIQKNDSSDDDFFPGGILHPK